MSFEIDFELGVRKVIINNIEIDFRFKYIQINNIKLKYIKPRWYLNLTTGNYQYYIIHPLREQDIDKQDFTISCEVVAEMIKEFNFNLFEYLNRLEKQIGKTEIKKEGIIK